MKIKTLLIINAVVAVLFGLAFVILPVLLMEWYGNAVEEPMKYVGQLFGAALITIGLLSYSLRNIEKNGIRRAIVLSFFLGYAVGFVVTLIGQLGEVVNNLGWSTVGIYFLLMVGFGYFFVAKQSD